MEIVDFLYYLSLKLLFLHPSLLPSLPSFLPLNNSLIKEITIRPTTKMSIPMFTEKEKQQSP